MTPARIDPRIKHLLKTRLEDYIYQPAYALIKEKINEVIRVNGNLQRFEHPSFSYRGQFYNGTNYLPRFKNQYLDETLRETMDNILAGQTKMEREELPYVRGYFTRALNLSNSFHDYYKLLPESIHSVLNNVAGLVDLTIPPELTQEQVDTFHLQNEDWLLLVKRRMVLNLITT